MLTASLDFEDTVDKVAALTVPGLADYCTVHLLEADDTIRTLAIASVPAHLDAARRLLEVSPPGIADPAGIGAVVREGEALLIPEITDEMLRTGIQDPVVLEATLALEIGSHLSVPLVVGGRTIGALALTSTRTSGRRYDAEDMTLAREMASRARVGDRERAPLFVARGARGAAGVGGPARPAGARGAGHGATVRRDDARAHDGPRSTVRPAARDRARRSTAATRRRGGLGARAGRRDPRVGGSRIPGRVHPRRR